MIQHDRILLVSLIYGAFDPTIIEDRLWYNVPTNNRDALTGSWAEFIKLPAGHTYVCHGLYPTLSEDVCKGLVEKQFASWIYGFDAVHTYKDYQKKGKRLNVKTAKKSLETLIKHYGYEPEWCVVVGIS